MPIKKEVARNADELRAEYELSELKGGVRGKYYVRATAGTTFVLLEPDVAAAFPDGRTVNQALRALIKVAESRVRTAGSRTRANRSAQETQRSRRSKGQRGRTARG